MSVPVPFGPGRWKLTSDSGAYHFFVTRVGRDWVASWHSEDAQVSDRKAGTLDEALRVFPKKTADKFRMVLHDLV